MYVQTKTIPPKKHPPAISSGPAPGVSVTHSAHSIPRVGTAVTPEKRWPWWEWWINLLPPEGLIKAWLPWLRPAIRPLFLGGGTLGAVRWPAMVKVCPVSLLTDDYDRKKYVRIYIYIIQHHNVSFWTVTHIHEQPSHAIFSLINVNVRPFSSSKVSMHQENPIKHESLKVCKSCRILWRLSMVFGGTKWAQNQL